MHNKNIGHGWFDEEWWPPWMYDEEEDKMRSMCSKVLNF